MIDGSIDVSTQCYGFADQALTFVHGNKSADLGTASRLPHDGDIRWVATEGFDVVLHPFEGFDKVEDADIAGIGVARIDRREIGESNGAETVVDRDENGIAITTEVLAVVAILFDAIAIGETTTVDPEEDGTLFAIGQALGPNV